VLIALCLLGALIGLVRQRAGIIVTLTASLCLFVLATPSFSSCLLVWLEREIPDQVDLTAAQAIVVLGADSRIDGREADSPGPEMLERLILTAAAYKRLHLPVAVSGGVPPHSQTPAAELMKFILEQYFAVPVTWSEEQAETTYDNAAYTARLVEKAGIRNIVVVTQARDAPRAIWSFERVGLHAIAWPAPRAQLEFDRLTDYLPSTGALQQTFYALHELIGGIYYRIRY